MLRKILLRLVFSIVILGFNYSLFSQSAFSQENFEALWLGSFDGWVIENADDGNFTVRDSLLHVEGSNGWLRSEKQYSNYILRCEFRWLTDDADSGIYVRAIADEPFFSGWPGNSYQVQVRNPQGESRFSPVGGLFRHGTPTGDDTLDEQAMRQAYRGTNEWHVLEINVQGTLLRMTLNGIEIAQADNIVNSTGYIGVQSELGVIEYRVIEIAETPE